MDAGVIIENYHSAELEPEFDVVLNTKHEFNRLLTTTKKHSLVVGHG